MSLGLNGSSAGASLSEFVIGSYNGTGNSVTLTFDKPPKALLVKGYAFFSSQNATGESVGFWMDTSNYITIIIGPTANYSAAAQGHTERVTLSGNQITLPNAICQDGRTYGYIAFF